MAAARMRDNPEEVKPRSDVYTGLLGISLAALVIACVLVGLDWSGYKEAKPPKPSIQVPQPTPKEQPAPQPGQPPNP
jgi:hypothetical protein